MKFDFIELCKKTIWLRHAQLIINDYYKKDPFKVPVHMAIGHEALAVAVDANFYEHDSLFLTHRNIHFNLVRQETLNEELNEYYLSQNGLANGHLGSMNLSNPAKGVQYTSSILGNNMPIACGYALANKAKDIPAVTFVVTGDGAIEEGSFYESLLFMKTYELPVILIIENNNWSLATSIDERRQQIDFKTLAKSLNIDFVSLDGNDVIEYSRKIDKIRSQSLQRKAPILIEVQLTTLGYRYIYNEDFPNGKFINYHSGPAPQVSKSSNKSYPVINRDNSDPLHVLSRYYSPSELISLSDEMLKNLNLELASA